MRHARIVLSSLVLLGLATAQSSGPAAQSSPAFEKIKSLAGEWEGKAIEGEKELPKHTSFRVVSDGSAVMNVLNSGEPGEMVSLFHMDGKELLLTHYCSAHNQPRMRMVASIDPNTIAFEFKDATNLASLKDGHMDHMKIIFVDADHHVEEWSYLDNGKMQTGRFEFHRKK
ncbi:MAG TPA: hypothetical protein VEW69_08035 [Alphaproteobacteria bacterium]|nr:hypothetical protein [Alphaproteobacteria bacterium]